MRIGIDARLIRQTGVGRYIRNLIKELAKLDTKNEYIVFLQSIDRDSFTPPNKQWTVKIVNVRWHTVKEQIVMPWVLWKAHLDIVHIPYFTIPILYPGKIIATIHDLIVLHVDTGNASTLPYFLYKIRRLGYAIIMRLGLYRATRIIAVSQATKQEIIDHFHIASEKILVTYEGVDKELLTRPSEGKNAKVPEEYFLYVGNAYPHKNVTLLLQAYKDFLLEKSHKNTQLVFVGKEDYFYRRLYTLAHALGLDESVTFWGEANDADLRYLYDHAKAILLPSQMEGFGLPALEALARNCPVICSDIPVFKELFKNVVTFARVNNSADWVDAMNTCLQNKNNKPSPKAIEQILNNFSWSGMAKQTLNAYEDCIRV